MPKNTKFMKNIQRGQRQRKTFKGRISYVRNLDQEIWKGLYGAIAKESARVSESQLKAAEFAIKRVLKKNGKIWIRINPNVPVTKKPTEVRMGKGKGSIKYHMARVSSGSILFELYTSSEILAKKAYKVAASKLPLQTKFIVSSPLNHTHAHPNGESE